MSICIRQQDRDRNGGGSPNYGNVLFVGSDDRFQYFNMRTCSVGGVTTRRGYEGENGFFPLYIEFKLMEEV